ncbi:MAG: acyl-CoA dehydrogenase C-terminal domain-containing protein, partial [Alphaproteobacteria bacterium]
VASEIERMRGVASKVARTNSPGFGHTAARLRETLGCLERATEHMLDVVKSNPSDALAGATPYLRLFGLAAGATALAEKALAAREDSMAGSTDEAHVQRIATARFFAEHLATAAPGLETSVTTGAESVTDVMLQLAS